MTNPDFDTTPQRLSSLEAVSHQFARYVESHSDELGPQNCTGTSNVRQGLYEIHAEQPFTFELVSDRPFHVSRAAFIEYAFCDDSAQPTDSHGYSILLQTVRNSLLILNHDPMMSRFASPYAWYSTAGKGTCTEQEVLGFLKQLQEYEAQGKMIKMTTPSTDSEKQPVEPDASEL